MKGTLFMEEFTCSVCMSKNTSFPTEYGTKVCTSCGTEDFKILLCATNAFTAFSLPLHTPATYTRVKRFTKYVNRASMMQSTGSIPEDTWVYLLEGRPYRSPGNIVRRLKKAPKKIRKKCYDSLPLLVKELCPHLTVPQLSEHDKYQAMVAFRRLDQAYNHGEPFVSYLFALEYILQHIGRGDMLPFINKICCKKRRNAYTLRLDRVFQ